MKVAAVQLESVVGDVAENLRRCEALGDEAGAAGAEWIVLPEFFSTGMGFVDALADAALPPDGAAMALLQRLATRHSATVGGSFVCRDDDGNNRNAFFLVGPDGRTLGRHDKDLPTMWENCYYVGGTDDGVIDSGDFVTGAAVCWEFMRTQTARRLRGQVDLVVGGSAWWSYPPWPPKAFFARLERANAVNAAKVAPAMAQAVGAPVVHSSHCGTLECGMPLIPLAYRGWFQGHAMICDAHGNVLAHRTAAEGQGIVVADVTPGRVEPSAEIPDRFWMHRRGIVTSTLWTYQNAHGKRWYRKHTLGRPTADQKDPSLTA
ncbi:MAG TPA: carbon-nitrogen hydrolase family protein [Sporichthya sp.]|nr:carbon-nitrogen hydrolase family protein [Sporichthya sp.]